MKLITIFTPTYNREKTLGQCYESLVAQTSQNFVWQVIDDGSSDNTEELVKGFQAEGRIEIVYVKKQNGGKASAINMSLDMTDTALWVCLDSDDYFFPNAVETYESLYPQIKDREDICGLFSVRSNPDGSPMMGMDVPEEVEVETQLNIRHKYNVKPEYVQVYKTEIAKQYKFPLFEGERFFPLSYMQDAIDQKYKLFVFRKPTMVCVYQADGITRNHKKVIRKNPKGYTEFRKQHLTIAPNLMFKLKAGIGYDTGCLLSKNGKGIVKGSPAKLTTVLMAPLGFINYLRYRKG
jgi:Glycosyltransferases involved in cell wall biogenesis